MRQYKSNQSMSPFLLVIELISMPLEIEAVFQRITLKLVISFPQHMPFKKESKLRVF